MYTKTKYLYFSVYIVYIINKSKEGEREREKKGGKI